MPIWAHMRRNVVSYLALLVALSGTAYAAIQIPRNSVGSGAVRNESLRGKDVRADSLTGLDVDESSLALPAGPPGPKGDPGWDQITESEGNVLATSGPPAVQEMLDLPGPASMSVSCSFLLGSSVVLTNPSSDPMRWWLDQGGSNPETGITSGGAPDAFSTLQTGPDNQVWRGTYPGGSFTALVFTTTADSIMLRTCEWSAQLIVDQ